MISTMTYNEHVLHSMQARFREFVIHEIKELEYQLTVLTLNSISLNNFQNPNECYKNVTFIICYLV